MNETNGILILLIVIGSLCAVATGVGVKPSCHPDCSFSLDRIVK